MTQGICRAENLDILCQCFGLQLSEQTRACVYAGSRNNSAVIPLFSPVPKNVGETKANVHAGFRGAPAHFFCTPLYFPLLSRKSVLRQVSRGAEPKRICGLLRVDCVLAFHSHVISAYLQPQVYC